MSPDPSRVRMTGPLAPYARGFRQELAARGYARSSAAAQLRVMAHLSRWLEGQGLDACGLTLERVEQFTELRRGEGRGNHVSPRAIAPLLDHLRSVEVVPAMEPPQAHTAVDRLLERYRVFLVAERGLAERTVARYERIARRFFSSVNLSGEFDPEALSAVQVNRFLSAQCAGRTPGSASNVASSLRSLLRFLHLEGRTGLPLAQAVLAGPVRSGSGLPQAVDAEDVRRLLKSCDRRRAMGRRDYAVLVPLSRMGLRAGEVAGLELDDIYWRRGEIVIRGKGARCERLPVPTDVGEALAVHLRRGRPGTGCRRFFGRMRAPYRGLGVSSISTVVYRACDRAGLPRVGAHRLRHTTATEMLRHGAPLSEVGQVLRHRSAQTTAIYAKVDHQVLKSLALSWPGGGA